MNGVMLGSTYALLGIGLTLVFGIMRIVNFTHGEFYALGAYMAYMFVAQLGVNFFIAILLATTDRHSGRRGARILHPATVENDRYRLW